MSDELTLTDLPQPAENALFKDLQAQTHMNGNLPNLRRNLRDRASGFSPPCKNTRRVHRWRGIHLRSVWRAVPWATLKRATLLFGGVQLGAQIRADEYTLRRRAQRCEPHLRMVRGRISASGSKRRRQPFLLPRLSIRSAVGGVQRRGMASPRCNRRGTSDVHRARGLLRRKLVRTTSESVRAGQWPMCRVRSDAPRTPRGARVRSPCPSHTTHRHLRDARSGERNVEPRHAMPAAPRSLGGHPANARGGAA